MAPSLEIENGGWRLSPLENEHPELSRANIAQASATAEIYFGLWQRNGKEVDKREAEKQLAKFLPPSLIDETIRVAGGDGDEKLTIKIVGIDLGESENPEDLRRIYYVAAKEDPRLTSKLAKGLSETLQELNPERSMLFLEKYLAWMGNALEIKEGPGDFILKVRYFKKDLSILMEVGKNEGEITLRLGAADKKTYKGQNIIYWLNRAKNGLLKIGRGSRSGELIKQERSFLKSLDPYLETNNEPRNLIITASRQQQDQLLSGPALSAFLQSGQEVREIAPPSVEQLSRLLVRLDPLPGATLDLAQQIRDEQQRAFIQAAENPLRL